MRGLIGIQSCGLNIGINNCGCLFLLQFENIGGGINQREYVIRRGRAEWILKGCFSSHCFKERQYGMIMNLAL